MKIECVRCDFSQIEHLRAHYRREMRCQILHDSFHARPGWVEWYAVLAEGQAAGYGAVIVGGPWAGSRALFEAYLQPEFRGDLIPALDALILTAQAGGLLLQTNDPTMFLALHQFGSDFTEEALIFERGRSRDLPNPGVTMIRNEGADGPAIFPHQHEPVGDWLVQHRGEVVATGGYLSHYNPPYVDLYMEVRPDMRRKGFGSYLVQELGRLAEAAGKIACARCAIANQASLKTLQRAGMVECALRGTARIQRKTSGKVG